MEPTRQKQESRHHHSHLQHTRRANKTELWQQYHHELQQVDPFQIEEDRFFQRQTEHLCEGYQEVKASYKLSEESYSFRSDIKEKDISREYDFKIKHECNCMIEKECHGVHCNCYLTPRQICVIGQCCPKCIELKNEFLMTTRGWQLQKEKKTEENGVTTKIQEQIKENNSKNLHYLKMIKPQDPYLQQLTFCTCKKSHCQKKYCLCYERGQSCGQFCSCIECENQDKFKEKEEEMQWQRYAISKPTQQQLESYSIDSDIEKFIHVQLMEAAAFSMTMEFEPPDFNKVPQYTE